MWRFQTKLTGKVAQVYNNLEFTDAYDFVKEVVLAAFSLNLVYSSTRNFALEKPRAFTQWMS